MGGKQLATKELLSCQSGQKDGVSHDFWECHKQTNKQTQRTGSRRPTFLQPTESPSIRFNCSSASMTLMQKNSTFYIFDTNIHPLNDTADYFNAMDNFNHPLYPWMKNFCYPFLWYGSNRQDSLPAHRLLTESPVWPSGKRATRTHRDGLENKLFRKMWSYTLEWCKESPVSASPPALTQKLIFL